MQKVILSGSWLLVVFMLVASACAPAAPVPAPQSAPAPQVVVPAPQPTQVLTPEEATWAKVVEAAKKEGKLVSYSFFMSGDVGVRMKRAFKERTGLDVEFITSTGAIMLERIKAERRGSFQVASILDTSVTFLAQAKIEGLTEAAGPLPELQNKEMWKQNPIFDKEGHILASATSLLGPWINTKLVKPGEEPKSWRDLLQPQWKKKIGTTDPDTSPGPVYAYYQLVKKHGILDDAYFRELGKVAVLYPNNRIEAEAMAKGDMAITFAENISPMASFLEARAPIKAIDMEEGVVGLRTSAVIFLTQAPHPNAARVFVNWWFSREGQLIFHEAYGSESSRKDVPSFVLAPGRFTPKKVFEVSAEDDMEAAKIQRERVVKNLLLGK